jgi:hypothetical protein
VTEQNQAPADVDDAEGHIDPQSAEDTEDYRRTEEATRDHTRTRDDADDTEGHQSLLNRGIG